jgi:HlyD family secretion protein
MTRAKLTLCAATMAATAALAACHEGAPATPRASGYVEATETRVAAKVPGRVAEVRVVEGAHVARGDVLATIDTADLDLALRRAQADRAQADAQVRLLERGARAEDIDQARAQVSAAQADVAAAQSEVDAARADEARFAQLVERRAGSEKQRDDATSRRKLAEARLRAAADRASAAGATLARLPAGARPEEIQAARARVAAADAAIASIEHDRGETIIIAPTSGIVTSRVVEPGELVSVGAPVVVILDLDNAWVNAYVEEPLVPQLRIDQAAAVVTDAGDRLPGRIAFIAPRAEFTPRNVQTADERAKLVYRVKVTLDNHAGILKPGMPVEVELAGGRS